MLRLFVIALLVANLAYFAWSRGSLSGLGLAPAQQHEPERLKAQIAPSRCDCSTARAKTRPTRPHRSRPK